MTKINELLEQPVTGLVVGVATDENDTSYASLSVTGDIPSLLNWSQTLETSVELQIYWARNLLQLGELVVGKLDQHELLTWLEELCTFIKNCTLEQGEKKQRLLALAGKVGEEA